LPLLKFQPSYLNNAKIRGQYAMLSSTIISRKEFYSAPVHITMTDITNEITALPCVSAFKAAPIRKALRHQYNVQRETNHWLEIIQRPSITTQYFSYSVFNTICFGLHDLIIRLFYGSTGPYKAKDSSLSRLQDHTETHHIRQYSSRRVMSPLHRPLT